MHGPWLRDEPPRPEQVFVVITWIFPLVMGAGVCAFFACCIGLAHQGRVEPRRHWLPVLELIPICTSGTSPWRPVPSRDAVRAETNEGHPCREWGGS